MNDSQSDCNRDLKVRTYTNVGIECRICSDPVSGRYYATLDSEFIAGHSALIFALRFSADRDLLPILEKYRGNDHKIRLETAKGLFGRYDYLLHIDLKEFAEIYPILCEKKFGVLEQAPEQYREGEPGLKNILRYPYIKNINERILVELSAFNAINAGNREPDADYLSRVKHRNNQLFDRINALNIWRIYFAEEDRAFRDLHRGMVGIYKTFSAIGMEKDAYINWLMFCRDMDVLCECLEVCLQKYKNMSESGSVSEVKKRTHRLRLLKDWRINIQALNQYTRLVQNINYQTYQSPIYEIQTQIDTEKTMIAYRQAMMSYMDSYIESKEMGIEDVIPSIPIIYPDLAKDRVEVIAPFSNQKKDGGEPVKREIICTVPSFEYFGRLYDLLPWMIHESSHHLRILNREERNHFFIEYVFSYVYSVVIENALPFLANDELYKTIGRVERHLIDSMVEITREDFREKKNYRNGRPHFFRNFGFEEVIYEIDVYLGELFNEKASFEGKQTQYEVKKTQERIVQFFLNEYRRTGLLKDQSLERILDIKTGKFSGEGDEIIEPLLNHYFDQVCMSVTGKMKEAGIRIEDMKIPQEWFEKRALEVDGRLMEAGASQEAIMEYHFKTR